jgi:hypothetical protein
MHTCTHAIAFVILITRTRRDAGKQQPDGSVVYLWDSETPISEWAQPRHACVLILAEEVGVDTHPVVEECRTATATELVMGRDVDVLVHANRYEGRLVVGRNTFRLPPNAVNSGVAVVSPPPPPHTHTLQVAHTLTYFTRPLTITCRLSQTTSPPCGTHTQQVPLL